MNFFYEAIDGSGKTVLGKIDAGTEMEAQRMLVQMGYRPQSIAPNPAASNASVAQSITAMGSMTGMPVASNAQVSMAPPMGQLGSTNRTGNITMSGNAAKVAAKTVNKTMQRSQARPAVFGAPPADASTLGGVSSRDLLLFFQQLASLVKSGMTIYAALDNLSNRTRNKNLAQVGKEMADAARNGKPITDVMAHYPRIFPDHIVGMVRAGELGGFLEIVLAEIALNYEQNLSLYRGSWLPKLMATQAWLGLAVILPFFPSLFNSLDFWANMRLYLMREMIILPIFFGIYLLVKWGARYIQLPHLQYFRDSWALRLPPFGDLQRQAALSAFVRMLRKLYHAGVAPIHAWEAAMNTADNVVIREKLAESYILMQQGKSFADAFAATGLFADNVEQLVVTGQLSGEVVESLDQAADIYQERVDDALRKSRMMILRMGVIAMLVLGGGALIWMTRTYFQGQFDFVCKMFPETC